MLVRPQSQKNMLVRPQSLKNMLASLSLPEKMRLDPTESKA
jgi:hypothetical protein